jgi:aminopeptidase N
VDAALAEDNTANGAQFAAQARATIPTLAGKQAAWDSVFGSDALPNTIVRFTGLGFQRAADKAVLASFVAPYFAALQDVWASRTYKIAEYLVEGMYPAPLANEALRDATRAWLDANPEPAALRRMVVENLAGVERALAAQKRDAQ